jgi:hypothetical protein
LTTIDPAAERRNLHPHAEARLAMSIWCDEYAQQRLGCMDWYDSLPGNLKRKCRMALDAITGLPREKA